MTQLNMLTYYSIFAIAGTLLAMIATFSFFQTATLFAATEWMGFYGESFNSVFTLLLIPTLVLAGSVPAHVVILWWNERYHSLPLRVVEEETRAALADEPVFYDPPTTDGGKKKVREEAGAFETFEPIPKPSPRRVA
jgi:hypothetical protein